MKRSPDSTVHTLVPEKPSRRRPLTRRLRVPNGAQVTTFPVDTNGTDTQRPPTRRSITAAAQVLGGKKVERSIKRPSTEAWQREAWALRDETGELRFIGDRQARACSQARLFVGRKDSNDSEPRPVEDGRPAEIGHALFGNAAAVEQSLRRAAQHLVYNGESVLVVKEHSDGGLEWSSHSALELTGKPGSWKLNDGVNKRDLDDTEMVIRAWNPHPEWLSKADAPVRAVLPQARELRALSMYVSSQIDSRLAGAGLLLLPQGIESMHRKPLANDPDPDGGVDDDAGDDADDDYTFADELTEYFVTPIQDRESAAAVVPFMAEVPIDLIDKIQHITFDSPLDSQTPALREEAIRRIGLGMDSDPSVLLGQATSNHWSAWAVDENETKFGVAPVVSTVCHAFTVGLLHPLLENEGVADFQSYQVWFDLTPLQVRPDRSKDAQALFDKKVISAEVLRRENGFGDDDKPADKDVERERLWEFLQLRPDIITAESAPAILDRLGVSIDLPVADTTPVGDGPGNDTPADAAPPSDSADGVAPEPPNSPPTQGEPG